MIWNCLPQYGRVTIHNGVHIKGLHGSWWVVTNKLTHGTENEQ